MRETKGVGKIEKVCEQETFRHLAAFGGPEHATLPTSATANSTRSSAPCTVASKGVCHRWSKFVIDAILCAVHAHLDILAVRRLKRSGGALRGGKRQSSSFQPLMWRIARVDTGMSRTHAVCLTAWDISVCNEGWQNTGDGAVDVLVIGVASSALSATPKVS